MSNNTLPNICLDSEKVALGTLIMDFHFAWPKMSHLERTFFRDEKNQIVFETLQEIIDIYPEIDLTILSAEMIKNNTIEKIGGTPYLVEIAESWVSSHALDSHLKFLTRQNANTELNDLSKKIGKATNDPLADPRKIVESISKATNKINFDFQEAPQRDMSSAMMNAVDFVEKRKQSHKELSGITTGFSLLDYILDGFSPADFIILAARPSMGKTSFATDLAINAAKEGHPVGFISLEMTELPIALRMLSSVSDIPLRKLKTKEQLESYEWKNINHAATKISSLPIVISDPSSFHLHEVLQNIRKMKAEHDIQLCVLDYLQLITNSKMVENQNQWIAHCSKSLKSLARELKISILCLSQLSRAPEQRAGDHRPQLSDLRDSGAIEQDGDKILFIYRPEVYLNEEQKRTKTILFGKNPVPVKGLAEIIIAKNRNGETSSVWLEWKEEMTTFRNRQISREENQEKDF